MNASTQTGPGPVLHRSRPWFVLLLAIGAGVGLTGSLWGPAEAGYLLAAAMAVLGAVRAAAPPGLVGPLAVRSRTMDVAVAVGFAAALALLTYTLPTAA